MPTARQVRDEAVGLFTSIAIALAVAMVPRIVVGQPYTIPSASMEPTLEVGDYILVSKYPYGWSRHSIPFSPPLPHGRLMGKAPARGDVVVFKEPRDGRTDIIKRLVGLPGDRIQVVGGTLRINGRAVPREPVSSGLADTPFGQLAVNRYKETLPNGRHYVVNGYGANTSAGNTGVYVVPAGCYFMMGDNRDNSLDSRFNPGEVAPSQSACPWNAALDRYLPREAGAGFVPADDLVGRADRVLFSWKHGASVFAPWNGFRWDRTFKKIGAETT